MWTICLVWRQLKRRQNIHHRSYLHPYYADCVNSPWVKHPDSAALANSSWCSRPMYCKQMGHTGSLRGPYIRRKTSVNSGNQFGLKPKRQVHRVLFFLCFFYPSTCSCPFLTPSRNPCNSLARLPSTNFSRMQASKHQVNCGRATSQRAKRRRSESEGI